MTTRPQQILIDAFLHEARGACADLRKRGWPVETLVEHLPETNGFRVSLQFTLPVIPVPVEARSVGEPTGKDTT